MSKNDESRMFLMDWKTYKPVGNWTGRALWACPKETKVEVAKVRRMRKENMVVNDFPFSLVGLLNVFRNPVFYILLAMFSNTTFAFRSALHAWH